MRDVHVHFERNITKLYFGRFDSNQLKQGKCVIDFINYMDPYSLKGVKKITIIKKWKIEVFDVLQYCLPRL